MTTEILSLQKALEDLIRKNPGGLAVQYMQEMLFREYQIKASYRDIEQTLIGNSELFSERDWKWLLRQR